ncbi:forkhead box protein N1-like [Ornithodoros turicata]|uniref:forkhead box protein N1-like n=1 Tax=Ornithodoros turicata TaxID=34597 RepID=UPI0031391C14
MELYEDAFKLQEMIESDIQSELDSFVNANGMDLGSDLGDLPNMGSVDSLDSLDSNLAPDASVWLESHGISLISDLDGLEGLLVNPQTGLPTHQLQATAPSMAPVSQTTVVNVTVSSVAPVTVKEENVGSVTYMTAPSSLLPTPSPRQQSVDEDKMYPKPAYSYSCLIAMALKNSQTGSLPVNEIYNFMLENFPYFRTAPNGWKNSVRHNLSLNKCFEKIEKPGSGGGQRKGCLWAMNPAKVHKMAEEVLKWSKKDPIAIRRSMANPERLELLERGCFSAPKLMDGVPVEIMAPDSSVSDEDDEDDLPAD